MKYSKLGGFEDSDSGVGNFEPYISIGAGKLVAKTAPGAGLKTTTKTVIRYIGKSGSGINTSGVSSGLKTTITKTKGLSNILTPSVNTKIATTGINRITSGISSATDNFVTSIKGLSNGAIDTTALNKLAKLDSRLLDSGNLRGTLRTFDVDVNRITDFDSLSTQLKSAKSFSDDLLRISNDTGFEVKGIVDLTDVGKVDSIYDDIVRQMDLGDVAVTSDKIFMKVGDNVVDVTDDISVDFAKELASVTDNLANQNTISKLSGLADDLTEGVGKTVDNISDSISTKLDDINESIRKIGRKSDDSLDNAMSKTDDALESKLGRVVDDAGDVSKKTHTGAIALGAAGVGALSAMILGAVFGGGDVAKQGGEEASDDVKAACEATCKGDASCQKCCEQAMTQYPTDTAGQQSAYEQCMGEKSNPQKQTNPNQQNQNVSQDGGLCAQAVASGEITQEDYAVCSECEASVGSDAAAISQCMAASAESEPEDLHAMCDAAHFDDEETRQYCHDCVDAGSTTQDSVVECIKSKLSGGAGSEEESLLVYCEDDSLTEGQRANCIECAGLSGVSDKESLIQCILGKGNKTTLLAYCDDDNLTDTQKAYCQSCANGDGVDTYKELVECIRGKMLGGESEDTLMEYCDEDGLSDEIKGYCADCVDSGEVSTYDELVACIRKTQSGGVTTGDLKKACDDAGLTGGYLATCYECAERSKNKTQLVECYKSSIAVTPEADSPLAEVCDPKSVDFDPLTCQALACDKSAEYYDSDLCAAITAYNQSSKITTGSVVGTEVAYGQAVDANGYPMDIVNGTTIPINGAIPAAIVSLIGVGGVTYGAYTEGYLDKLLNALPKL